jgi:hypothetical protein
MIPEVRACSTPALHHPALPHQPDITRERRGPADDRDAPPADHPELAARGKELAPNVHEALERCGTVKVTVWGAGFHADSVVQIRETPEAIPEPILLGETTVRNGSSSGATPSTSDSEKGSSRVRKSSGLR